MSINPINNYFRMQNATNGARLKRPAEELSFNAVDSHGKDEVEISPDASFKAQLSSCSKAYAAEIKQDVSIKRIEELKEAYAADNCPISGRDIASAVLKYTFGINDR